MLPDYPELKKTLEEFANLYLRQRMQHHLGPLASIGRVFMHEGTSSFEYRSPHGSAIRETQATEISKSFAKEDMRSWDIVRIKAYIDDFAESLAREFTMRTFEAVKEETTASGTAIDLRGRALSAEAILDGYALLEIDFSGDGSPVLPKLSVPPEVGAELRTQLHRIQVEKELQNRWSDILKKKWEDWNARESRRELAG